MPARNGRKIAHRTAWAAVKRSYVKEGETWKPAR
jgi:cation transport regulator ChaB